MYSKTLGPENARLLTTLVSQKRFIFAIVDARRISGKSYQATVVLLQRLKKAGWIVSLGAGKYAVVPLNAGNDAVPEVNQFVVARELVNDAPYYISHGSAFAFHQMHPGTCESVSVTTTRRISKRQVLNITYKFMTTKPTSIWGYRFYQIAPGEEVIVSDLERTIIDGLARPELCAGFISVITGLCSRKDDFDFGKLVFYARKIGNQAVAKRLGYLLELFQFGTSQVTDELQKSIDSKSYISLDPQSPPMGKYLARWRLRLNRDLEKTIKIANHVYVGSGHSFLVDRLVPEQIDKVL